jgi:hypothetical protein
VIFRKLRHFVDKPGLSHAPIADNEDGLALRVFKDFFELL